MTDEFDAAFTRLFTARYQALRMYLDRLTGDPDDAADVAQNAFVRLRERGQMPDDPNAWLISVAHNLIRDQQRNMRGRLRLLTTWTSSVPGPTSPNSAGDDLVAEERRTAVRAALERLPQRDRQILLLKHSGYSYAEIAHATAVPVGSVGTYLIRATAAFRRVVSEESILDASR